MNEFYVSIFIVAILSSIAAGITGTYVNLKKMSYIASGIAHGAIGGIGIAIFIGTNPLNGAFVFAIVSSLLIAYTKFNSGQNEDILISLIWSAGMATGIIFSYLTPGYNVDLLSYLFGNLLLVSSTDIVLLLILDIILVFVFMFFYRHLLYITFDELYSSLVGLPVFAIYLGMTIFIALTIILLVRSIGLILVIAILSIPSSISMFFTKSLPVIFISAILICFVGIMTGFYLSINFNLPSGASIILILSVFYLLSFLFNLYTRKKHLN